LTPFRSEKTAVLAIGDVSGKGIPAALFMVRAVTLLRMEASREVHARCGHRNSSDGNPTPTAVHR